MDGWMDAWVGGWLDGWLLVNTWKGKVKIIGLLRLFLGNVTKNNHQEHNIVFLPP
jgi:hypothetical protein